MARSVVTILFLIGCNTLRASGQAAPSSSTSSTGSTTTTTSSTFVPINNPLSPESTDIELWDLMCDDNQIMYNVQIYLYNSTMMGNDSKTFVDMPLKSPPEVVMQNYFTANPTTVAELESFVSANYNSDTTDFTDWTPEGTPSANSSTWASNPSVSYLAQLDSPNVPVAEYILKEWGVLGRQINYAVYTNQSEHTLLNTTYPYMVPGGRFREAYYWDSYWIIRGMLLNGMTVPSKYLILNFMQSIQWFGKVPNGMRQYYMDRSQPPFLSDMLRMYYEFTGDTSLFNAAVPLLVKEYTYFNDGLQQFDNPVINGAQDTPVWTSPPSGGTLGVTKYTLKNHTVIATLSDGTPVILSRYFQYNQNPRVEGFMPDTQTYVGTNTAIHNPNETMSHLRSAAESGMDFSSRWMNRAQFPNSYELEDVQTMYQIPVDLNSMLYHLAVDIANFALMVTNDSTISSETNYKNWMNLATARAEAMNALMYDASTGRWADVNMTANTPSQIDSAASFFPVWAGVANWTCPSTYPSCTTEREMSLNWLVNSSGLIQECGLLTTTVNSGQQWDSPNVWPPLVQIAVEALSGSQFLVNWTSPQFASKTFTKPYTGPIGYPTPMYQTADPGYYTATVGIVNTYMIGLQNGLAATGILNEKYNGYPQCYNNNCSCGVPGGGGEYTDQAGFGWTNGVGMDFMYNFLQPLNENVTKSSTSGVLSMGPQWWVALILGVAALY